MAPIGSFEHIISLTREPIESIDRASSILCGRPVSHLKKKKNFPSAVNHIFPPFLYHNSQSS